MQLSWEQEGSDMEGEILGEMAGVGVRLFKGKGGNLMQWSNTGHYLN